MIGDWVQNQNGVPFMVTAAMFWQYTYRGDFWVVFRPIQLTDEILNLNFPEPEIVAWWPTKDGRYHIEIQTDDREDELGATEIIISLRFVHELQHLLKICGIEKEIVLKN